MSQEDSVEGQTTIKMNKS